MRYYKYTVLLPKLFLRCYLFILKIQICGESLSFAEYSHNISMYSMWLDYMYLLILS